MKYVTVNHLSLKYVIIYHLSVQVYNGSFVEGKWEGEGRWLGGGGQGFQGSFVGGRWHNISTVSHTSEDSG